MVRVVRGMYVVKIEFERGKIGGPSSANLVRLHDLRSGVDHVRTQSRKSQSTFFKLVTLRSIPYIIDVQSLQVFLHLKSVSFS
jgi:hypothetical protein